jgi:hypothetical protein
MSTKVKNSSKPSTASAALGIPRVALTLKITRADYLRLGRLRLKELEKGHDLSHQEILYRALRDQFKKHGV